MFYVYYMYALGELYRNYTGKQEKKS